MPGFPCLSCQRLIVVAVLCLLPVGPAAADPLPSWKEDVSKAAILDFVAAVTTEGGPEFVPMAERVAVFDNDGTLWVEQPYYAQIQFALDRVHSLAPEHPEWKSTQPFKAVLENDTGALLATGEQGLLDLIMVTHAGSTTDEFTALVGDWISQARHRRFDRHFTELVYQPMLEVLKLSGGQGFPDLYCFRRRHRVHAALGRARLWPAARACHRVSSITEFRMRDGKPVLVRLPRGGLHRRQGGQTGGHPEVHRPPADRRVRELRRRSPDAAMGHVGSRPPARRHRPS